MLNPSATASGTHHRTTGQVALAALLVLVGLFVLAHTVAATRVSVVVIGWSALAAGAAGVLAAVIAIERRAAWLAALAGGLSASLGVVVLRSPDAAARTLTLIAGGLFLAGGIQRVVTATHDRRFRVVLIATGLASVAFGVIVLSDLSASSLTLLGRFVGLQILLDGVSLLLVGRLRAGLRERRRTFDTAPA